MAIINLETEGLINLKINNIDFQVDSSDIECINALDAFNAKYNGMLDLQLSKQLIAECKDLINKILGEKAYDKLFKKDTLKAYVLCFELINAFQVGITDIYSKSLENKAKRMNEMVHNLNQIQKQAEKVEEVKRKYGIQHRKPKRSSQKNKNKEA